MDYQKYLKYKTKYLQLKAKLTQLGGVIRWVVEDQSKKAITSSESTYIQKQYLARNTNVFFINPPDSIEKYRYQLNIGSGTGVRINFKNERVNIIQKNDTPTTTPGGRAVSKEGEYGEEQSSMPSVSKPSPISLDISRAQQIIKKYVEEFNKDKQKQLTDIEYNEIYSAKEALRPKQDNPEYSWYVIQFFEVIDAIYYKRDYDKKYFDEVLKYLSKPPGGYAAMPSAAMPLAAMPSAAMPLAAIPSSLKTAEQKLSSSTTKTSYGCTHDFCRANPGITGVHAILVVKGDNSPSGVLLGKERHGSYAGQYNMFGGSKDSGDCILSCLYREISEEARFLRIDKSINWENFVNIFMDSSGNFYGNRIHHSTSAVFVGVIRRGNLFFNAQGSLPVGTQQVYDGNSSKLVIDIKQTFTTLSGKVPSQYCEMDDVILFDPASPPPKITEYAKSNIRHLLPQIQQT